MQRRNITRTLAAALALAIVVFVACHAMAQRASGCANCHVSETTSQPLTPMGQALEFPGADPILRAHPRLTYRRGTFSYTLITEGENSKYSVTDGVHTLSARILWGMGAGAQTWILSLNGKLYESLVSYFPSLNGLGVTLGDEITAPRTLMEAIGRELGQQDVKSCFRCHATGAIVEGKLNLSSFQPGVTCKHCHAGADAHLSDISKGSLGSVPPHLGRLSSEDMSNFCGECHRTWSTVVLHRWFGEVNVRFAPYRLALSRCYDGADPRIRCVSCHDPHVNAGNSPTAYDPKCLACHETDHRPGSGAGALGTARLTKACPVGKSDCVTCHMPKVARADGHLTFTDHYIRVIRTGEPYPD